MERREVRSMARPVAEEDEDYRMATSEAAEEGEEEEGGQMVACELEAAAALAGLARCSALTGGALGSVQLKGQLVREEVDTFTRYSEVQSIATRQFCDNVSTAITNSEKTEEIVENIPSQLCSTSCQSNPVSKLRPKPTEAEKEARKLRRVLANRESARQTIRRRQATYLELTGKATYLLEENEILKKQMEVAVEEYNSLTDTNEVLKSQLAKLKKAEAGEIQEEPNTSQAENSSSPKPTTPIFQHSMVPCFWPSIFPSPDAFQFQYASHPSATCSSQFHMPQHTDPHLLGQEKQAPPLFIFPVPCFLPFPTQSNTLQSHTKDRKSTHQSSACSCSETRLPEDYNNQIYSEQDTRAEASSSKMNPIVVHVAGFTHPPEIVQYIENHPKPNTTSCHVDDTCDVNVVSAPESMGEGLSGDKNQDPIIIGPDKKSDDVFAATVARRRRKELMKLKTKHCYHRSPPIL